MKNYAREDIKQFTLLLEETLDLCDGVIDHLTCYFDKCQFQSGWTKDFKSFFYTTFEVSPTKATEQVIAYCIISAERHFKVKCRLVRFLGIVNDDIEWDDESKTLVTNFFTNCQFELNWSQNFRVCIEDKLETEGKAGDLVGVLMRAIQQVI